ncbi:CHD5-like protein domain-containing protein [Phthorimaea operculella]|nr:CHD5-like protein domain-containing protein [Phthorimaea operculella]
MIEVINGYLLVYFVILCLLSALVPHLGKTIAICFAKPSKQERQTWADILQLKAKQKTLSMKDDFAAYSKIQRKINVLENQLKDNTQSRRTKSLAIKGSIHIGLQAFVGLIILASVIWYRREPIVALKGNLFPLETILRYPSDVPNSISTHMWVLISNVSIRSLLKPFTS